jgi:hypothetical protein
VIVDHQTAVEQGRELGLRLVHVVLDDVGAGWTRHARIWSSQGVDASRVA